MAVASEHQEDHLTDHLAVDPMEAPEMASITEHRGDDQARPLLAARGAQEAVAVAEAEMIPATPTTLWMP